MKLPFPTLAKTVLLAALATTAMTGSALAQQPGKPSQQKQEVTCVAQPQNSRAKTPAKGQCLDGWQGKKQIANYKERGLKAPGQGKRWVESNGSYVLVEIATGIISQIVTPKQSGRS